MKENKEVADTNVGDIEKNSIEETIKQLKLMLKVRKEQKEIIECAGGSCINCNPDIKALSESIDILSDYKRVLKENEELKILEDDIQDKRIVYIDTPEFKENYIPVQKIKDKIEELNREIGKSIDNSKGGLDEEFIEKARELLVQKRILQELLEGRKI